MSKHGTNPGGDGLDRRDLLGIAAAATAGAALTSTDWVFAVSPRGAIVKQGQGAAAAEPYAPVFLSADELEAVARLCDVIIPRTGTPGARDARVHEYVDLAVSVEDEEERAEFKEGLELLDARCREQTAGPLHEASAEQLAALLQPLSDEYDAAEAKRRAAGDDEIELDASDEAAFFGWLKSYTIFGYYTSLEGRVEELGLPDSVTMETWRGCPHGEDASSHGGG